MAIYHLEGNIISRSQGRSSVASSAYRACERLVDEKTGLVHDFTNKRGDLVQSEILLPENAPKELADREKLWNTVEAGEKRKDAQLAREFNIALPKELTDAQNWALAKQFIQTEFVDRGMISDVAFHKGHRGQEVQPHIHVMLTMREVGPEGFGQKERAWNDKALLQHWREAWADTVNLTLAEHGIDARVDHRTLEAQGIDLEPQTKIGPKVAQQHMARLAEHQEKARANGERILNNPEIVLNALTQQQSTFTHQDIARMVNRYTDGQAQFQAAYNKVLACPELTLLGQDAQQHNRYTTRAQLQLETQLVKNAVTLAERERHVIPESIRADVAAYYTLDEQQQAAFDYLTTGGDIRNLVGLAGTGKTHLLGAVREAHEKAGYHVIGMTLAGKAAENLETSADIESRTVASHIASWDSGYSQLSRKDVVIIDEAGMLGSRDYGRILAEAQQSGAKVIPAFDTEQLQPINAGAAARAVAERTGFVELTQVRRQKEAWQREATYQLARGETAKALAAYDKHDNLLAYATKDAALGAMLENWQEVASTHTQKEQLLLAHTRRDVAALNLAAREIKEARGELQHSHSISTSHGRLEIAPGERVYFMRNEYKDLDVRNGTLGTLESIADNELTVRLDAQGEAKPERTITFSTDDYDHLNYGYAATLHKGQGATVDTTHVLASKYMDRHLTYVGLSRHTDNVNLYWDQETFKSVADVSQTLARENKKDFSLDYTDVTERSLSENEPIRAPNQTQEHKIDNAMPSVQSTQEPTPQSLQSENNVQTSEAARLQAAEQRMAQRQFDKMLARVEQNVGLTLSTELAHGDKGIYKGMTEIEGQRYGILDMGKGEGKIIPKELMESTHKNKEMEITQAQNKQGEQQIKATQSYERERQLEKSRGREIGDDFGIGF